AFAPFTLPCCLVMGIDGEPLLSDIPGQRLVGHFDLAESRPFPLSVVKADVESFLFVLPANDGSALVSPAAVKAGAHGNRKRVEVRQRNPPAPAVVKINVSRPVTDFSPSPGKQPVFSQRKQPGESRGEHGVSGPPTS